MKSLLAKEFGLLNQLILGIKSKVVVLHFRASGAILEVYLKVLIQSTGWMRRLPNSIAQLVIALNQVFYPRLKLLIP